MRCPDCAGSGVVAGRSAEPVDCPECEGKGQTENEPSRSATWQQGYEDGLNGPE